MLLGRKRLKERGLKNPLLQEKTNEHTYTHQEADQ